jgi:predicted branched-subunit amino acid permease
LGAVIDDPAVFALDFAFLAVFTALAISLWRGKTDILPWIVAALVSVAADQLLPGKWYVAVGGACGALTAVLASWFGERTA